MEDVERLKRVLLGLPDVGLRVGWLQEQLLRWSPDEAARLLDALAQQNEGAEPTAREAMLTVALVFAGLGDDDPTLDELRSEVAAQRLWSLARLLRKSPASPRRAPPAKNLPVPDYGTGRELTLGERRSLARRPDRKLFDKLLADPHPMVIRQLLVNPKITEDDVVRLATIRPARAEVMGEIARTYRWMRRSRVRMAMLMNPGAPAGIVMPLVSLCVRAELRIIVHSTDTSVALRATAHELLERRPPMEGEVDVATVQ